ncbi:MAG: hypothetical protein A2136_05805 [Chloroflexi bacterium RBG_16_54_11]|nr:MAG: hypothetical protein A2136_05805 [Chloroflexi bacterium RBG_16_54_11]
MNDEGKSRLRAKVVGRVQGVSFRYFVLEQAESLDLTGWVRNMWDGSVEVLAEGLHQNLEELLTALRVGPPMAKVANVEVEWQSYLGDFSDFRVKSSA